MSSLKREESSRVAVRKPVEIALPAPGDELEQDEEWVVVRTAKGWRKIRLHDYAEVYAVPGLYERWVYEIFQCQSPAKIRELLVRALGEAGVEPSGLHVLDLGAGNGCVAEELREIGVDSFIGVDIYDEAADAAERDRPGLYADYLVGDMTNLDDSCRHRLEKFGPNTLTCVAALGFGDIPPEVFAAAFNAIQADGWAAFTIKADFMDEADKSGFSVLIKRLIAEGVLDLKSRESYVHRVSTDGEELVYEAIIGRKCRDIPMEWVTE